MEHNILILFYDAIVFHIPDLRRILAANEEIEKQEGQLWVAWSLECEVDYPWTLKSEFRNIDKIGMFISSNKTKYNQHLTTKTH